MGVLRYLPSRYLMNFVYGGVFALKAGYSGATPQKDMLKSAHCPRFRAYRPMTDVQDSRYGGSRVRLIGPGLSRPRSRRIAIWSNAAHALEKAGAAGCKRKWPSWAFSISGP